MVTAMLLVLAAGRAVRNQHQYISDALSSGLLCRSACILKQWNLAYLCSPVCRLFAPVQNVTNQFTRIAQDPRVNFFGNVNVGRDITVDEIRKLYNAVSFSYK
jgi:hypothetical protein